MTKEDKIYVAGHSGLVGSAIMAKLKQEGYSNIIYRTSRELNLINQGDVKRFFEIERPDYVFMAAAKVGGIEANNTYRGEFIYENLMIQTNIIHSSYLCQVKKLLFLGSSCVYPKMAVQPIKESYLLTGPLEETNEAYAIAKIAGIKLCESYRQQYGCNFISVMPTNLYGPNDTYDLRSAHVIPALLKKFHDGKELNSKQVVAWGTGLPKREFLHVQDLADACYFLMLHYDASIPINVGTGEDISIKDLAIMIQEIVGFKGVIKWDSAKPDGTPQKLLDLSLIISLGWQHKIRLEDGLRSVYNAAFID